jgi:cation/acetate symporter
MGIAFCFCWLGSVTDGSPRAAKERASFEEQFVRAQTGLGASGTTSH